MKQNNYKKKCNVIKILIEITKVLRPPFVIVIGIRVQLLKMRLRKISLEYCEVICKQQFRLYILAITYVAYVKKNKILSSENIELIVIICQIIVNKT